MAPESASPSITPARVTQDGGDAVTHLRGCGTPNSFHRPLPCSHPIPRRSCFERKRKAFPPSALAGLAGAETGAAFWRTSGQKAGPWKCGLPSHQARAPALEQRQRHSAIPAAPTGAVKRRDTRASPMGMSSIQCPQTTACRAGKRGSTLSPKPLLCMLSGDRTEVLFMQTCDIYTEW